MDDEGIRDFMRLFELVNTDDLVLFEYRTDHFEIVVARDEQAVRHLGARTERPVAGEVADTAPGTATGPARSSTTVPGAEGKAVDPAPTVEPPRTEDAGGDLELDGAVVVRAPMLGTFYRAPNPNADPYVEVGDHVDVGATVGLIEAMKVFTAVAMSVAGSVKEILVANGELVAHDQPLMILIPD